MPETNLMIIQFPETSKAYQGLSILRQLGGTGQVIVDQAVLIERSEDGSVHVADGEDNSTGEGMLAGTLLGSVIGLIGGPLGLLFGLGAGALIGSGYDANRAELNNSALAELSRTVQTGSTVVAAELKELSPTVVDRAMAPLGGEITRRPKDLVLAELDAAEEASAAAAREADRVLREQRRTELKQRWDERKTSVKEKLGVGD